MDDIQPSSAAPAPDPAPAPDINGAPQGIPTAPTSNVGAPAQQPQPAAPPPETVGGGIRRGMRGTQYVVDAKGNTVDARTTAPSVKGEFGSILGGIVMGALAGASKARPGRIPSAEIGGGAGEGVGAAIQADQQRDQRNRGQAQTQFTNQQQVQRMSREQAETAAEINHLTAQTASEIQATRFADEEHPLHIAGLKAGLDEASQRIQKNAQDITDGALKFSENLGEMGITPQAVLTNWSDARAHAPSFVQGKTIPIFNGKTGEDGGVGVYDVQTLKNTPTMKPVTYKTYTSDKDGNSVEQINTLPAGTSALDYYRAVAAGHGQLLAIQSQQKVNMAVEAHKADIKEKNASAFQKNAEGQKAQQEASQIANLNPKGSGGLSGDAYLKTLPQPQQSLITSIAEGRNTKANIQNRKGDLTPLGLAVMQAYPDFDAQKAAKYGDTLKEYQSTKNGTAGGSLNSGATALKHLAELKQINDDNPLEVHIHGTKPNQRYNNLLDTVGDELVTFYGEPKTNEAIASKKNTLGGLTNRNSAIVEQAKAMSEKLQSFQQSWDNASPRESFKPPMPHIDNDARTALQKLVPDFVRANPQFAPQQQNGGQTQQQQPASGGSATPADPFAQFGGKVR